MMRYASRRNLSTALLCTAVLTSLTTTPACSDRGTDPADTFVGGPEHPASDGSYTAAIYSENGIASLEEVTLGGEDQWILIRGHDVSNPVLIFLHGGPGSPCLFYSRYAFGGLEEDLTVVAWDQRGCGKSYHADVDPALITREQLYADTLELINLMRTRFGIDRVYLMGISWGAILGSSIARDHPELLHAYFGVGQPVHLARTYPLALDVALTRATELGIQDAIDDLTALQAEPDIPWDQTWILAGWLEELGFGDIHDPMKWDVIRGELAGMLTEYTADDIANLDLDDILYDNAAINQDKTWLWELDLFTDIPSLAVPVYFMSGRYDYKTPGVLSEEFCTELDAPAGKQFFWFEDSAHAPILEQAEDVQNVILTQILP